MSTSASLPTAKELAQLKVAVLNSILNHEPFPGSDIILRFPDLPFVLAQSNIYLVDEEIGETIRIVKLNKPVQLVSEKKLKDITPKSGRTIFFKFRSKNEGRNRLSLHLDANVYSASDERTATLSSILIKFQKEGNIWVIPESPSFLSA